MPSRKRYWIAVVAVLLPAVLLVSAYQALQHEPDFYRVAVQVNQDVVREASRQMSSQVTVLLSDAQEVGRWHALFTDEQINAWLAVDLPEKHPTALPDDVDAPRVQITSEHVTIAWRQQTKVASTVVALRFDIASYPSGELGLRILSARAGLLPLSLRQVMEEISKSARNLDIPLRWSERDGAPVALIQLATEEGKRKLERATLQEGEIYLAGSTERVPGEVKE